MACWIHITAKNLPDHNVSGQRKTTEQREDFSTAPAVLAGLGMILHLQQKIFSKLPPVKVAYPDIILTGSGSYSNKKITTGNEKKEDKKKNYRYT